MHVTFPSRRNRGTQVRPKLTLAVAVLAVAVSQTATASGYISLLETGSGGAELVTQQMGESGAEALVNGHHYREYTKPELEAEERIYKAAEIDSGTTTNQADEITSIKGTEERWGYEVTKDLQTGEEYKSAPEAEIGDASISSDISGGTLPSTTADVTAMATETGGLTLLSGAAVSGIALGTGVLIGTGVDEIFGWPTLGSLIGTGEIATPQTFYYNEWEAPIRITGGPEECKKEASYMELLPTGAGGEECEAAQQESREVVLVYSTEKKQYVEEHVGGEQKWQGSWSGFATTFRKCPAGSWLFCNSKKEYIGTYSGEELQTYSDTLFFVVPTGEVTSGNSEHGGGLTPWSPGPVPRAYPAKELYTKYKSDVEQPSTAPSAPSVSKITSPKKTPLKTQERPFTTYIATEDKELGKKIGTEELPQPYDLEIPAIQPNELASTYKTELESLGFTDVNVQTLPESDTDPALGPGAATGVAPSPGTEVPPSTDVTVEANPDTAGPAEPTKGIGGPTLPGIKLPSFPVLCKGFPFGVPCWLIQTIEGWSTSASAPELGIENLEVEKHTVTGAKFKLSRLEPIMEKVRPAMVIFATIGLVLLFYRFAKGGGPPSGGGGDSSPDESSEASM